MTENEKTATWKMKQVQPQATSFGRAALLEFSVKVVLCIPHNISTNSETTWKPGNPQDISLYPSTTL